MSHNGAGQAKPDVQMLRAEIQQTRQDLGETVQALAAKADVKARAKEQIELTKQRMRDSAGHTIDLVRGSAAHAAHNAVHSAHDVTDRAKRNPVPVAAMLAAGAALVIVLMVLRGRRR